MTLRQPQPISTPVRGSRAAESHLGGALVAALWMICVAAGFAGQRYPYSRPKPPEPEPPAVAVERVEVQLGTPPPVSMTVALPMAKPPPTAPRPPEAPAILPMAVALPSPQIAFPVPVEAPAMIVERAAASYRVPEATNTAPPSTAAAPAAVPLTFGQGEGRQPAPSYPRRAVQEGQEGTVVARFVVDASGRVTAAEPVKPSPWPLLNEETLRTIRNKWRFPEGRVRVYEVVIRFELKK